MGYSIEQFKANGFREGGARPSLFEIIVADWPGSIPGAAAQTTVMAKAASHPPSVIDPIEVGYWGRRIKLAGDRSFPPWSITVYNDEDFRIRQSFENWHSLMNGRETNKMTITNGTEGGSAPSLYKRNIVVRQFSKAGSSGRQEEPPIYQYVLYGAFPVVIDPIQLDWEAINQVEQFNVEFHYDYWEYNDTTGLNVVSPIFTPISVNQ